MMAYQTRTRPAGTGRRFDNAGFGEAARALYGTRSRKSPGRLPANWRDRLPDPARYYAAHVEKLTGANSAGYAQGRCPFHDDHNASLSVHVAGRGLWKCFASCGGGDLVGFHMKVTGLPFADAVRDLIGLGVRA